MLLFTNAWCDVPGGGEQRGLHVLDRLLLLCHVVLDRAPQLVPIQRRRHLTAIRAVRGTRIHTSYKLEAEKDCVRGRPNERHLASQRLNVVEASAAIVSSWERDASLCFGTCFCGSPVGASERLLNGAHHLAEVELPLLQHELRRQALVVQRQHLLERHLRTETWIINRLNDVESLSHVVECKELGTRNRVHLTEHSPVPPA